MAISGGDGSIILTTEVDTSGINTGSLSIRSALQGVNDTVKKVQNSFSAFRDQKVTLATLNQAIKDQQYVLNSLNLEYAEYVAQGKAASTQAKELKSNIDAATVEMKEMQAAAVTLGAKGSTSINRIGIAMRSLLSYFIGIQTIFKVINFSGEAAQFATQTEASMQRLNSIYGEATQRVLNFIDTNSRAIGMSESASVSIASMYGNLLSMWADQSTNAELTISLLNQTAVVASQTGSTTTDVAERIRSGLLGNTEAIEDLGINVNIKAIEITDAFKRIANGRSWEQLNAHEQAQVRTLAILEQSTKKYGTTVAETSATIKNQFQAAYEDFKTTWGQVVNKVLIPVLKVLTQVFTIATKGLQIIARLTGQTFDETSFTGGDGNAPPDSTPSSDGGNSSSSGKSQEEKDIEAEEKAIREKIKALQKESDEEKKLANEIDDLRDKIKQYRKESAEEKNIEAEKEAIRDKIELLQKESDEEKRLAEEIDNLQKKTRELRKESPEEKAADEEAKRIKENIKELQKQNKQIKKNAEAKEEANQKEFASFDTIETLSFNQKSEEEKELDTNEDQIEALQEQLDLVNDKKATLKEARQEEIEGIQSEVEKRKDALDAINKSEKEEIENLRDEIDLLDDQKTALKEARQAEIEKFEAEIETRQNSLEAIRESEQNEIENLREQLEALSERRQALNDALSSSNGNGSGGIGIGEFGSDHDNSFVEKISGDLAAIMAIVGGALAAVGLILIFFGHIGWGIGFIIAGASIFAVSMATLTSDDQVTPISEKLMAIMAIAGIALTAIGLILLFGGHWQWGIGFIIAGASALAVAVVAVKSGNVAEGAKQMLLDIMLIAGTALLALGIILLLCGVISPLSIGLVVAGAATLAGAVAINPQAVGQTITKFFKDNSKLIIGVAVAILVLGVVLCSCGVISPLSIGLIVAGAGILATEVALNREETKKIITKFFQDNSELIVGVSLAILILGVILCFCGVITPLSIGLIAAGAVGLAAELVLNWEYVTTSISDFITNNSGLIVGVASALVVLGIILLFTGVAIPLAIGLIVAGGAILATELVLNWEYISTSITKFIQDNSGLIVGISLALIVLGIILLFTGVGIPLAIGLIIAGGAALATEVALNWDFIKEKVTETFDAIFTWVKTWGLLILGIILTLSGNFLLGIPLIISGANSLTEAQDPTWNAIVDKVKEVWNKIKAFWNQYIAPVFTAKWWADLGKRALNGLIGIFEKGINFIIDKINTFVRGIDKVISAVGDIFGQNWSVAQIPKVTIPRLAKGAVIPPNKEFLAVLGDQKHGTNIEAPLQTIVDAFNIALQGNANYGGGNTEVVLEIDGREFGRAVVEQGNRENRRIGTRLVVV